MQTAKGKGILLILTEYKLLGPTEVNLQRKQGKPPPPMQKKYKKQKKDHM